MLIQERAQKIEAVARGLRQLCEGFYEQRLTKMVQEMDRLADHYRVLAANETARAARLAAAEPAMAAAYSHPDNE